MKKWCRHIKWENLSDRTEGGFQWWLLTKFGAVQVTRNWKVCPICQAERPTRANIRAARLRFAMDNDL